MRCYELNPERMKTRSDMHEYMDELFGFQEELDAVNLDALNDSLSEITEETDLILTPSSIRKICESDYAYALLLVLGRAAEENPYIHVHFRKETKNEAEEI